MSEDWIQEFRDKLVWGPLPWKHVAKRWREHALILEDEKSDIEATATRRLGLLRRFYGWEWDFEQECYFCPICGSNKDNGHAEDCELAKELEERNDN